MTALDIAIAEREETIDLAETLKLIEQYVQTDKEKEAA